MPKIFTKPSAITTDVLLKRKHSSFGEGIEGPLRQQEARVWNRPLTDGEYFDEFVSGDIAKIWYWEGKVVCLEVKPMPRVIGDGKSTLRQLVTSVRSSFVAVDWSLVERIAHYQGVDLDSILPNGQSVLIDFRFLSSMHPSRLDNLNVINKYRRTTVLEQMEKAGPVFWEGIPENLRQQTLFTIDAIIDTKQQVSYLEMNCNPVVHPDAYAAMFEGLFGPPLQEPVVAPSISVASPSAAQGQVIMGLELNRP